MYPEPSSSHHIAPQLAALVLSAWPSSEANAISHPSDYAHLVMIVCAVEVMDWTWAAARYICRRSLSAALVELVKTRASNEAQSWATRTDDLVPAASAPS